MIKQLSLLWPSEYIYWKERRYYELLQAFYQKLKRASLSFVCVSEKCIEWIKLYRYREKMLPCSFSFNQSWYFYDSRFITLNRKSILLSLKIYNTIQKVFLFSDRSLQVKMLWPKSFTYLARDNMLPFYLFNSFNCSSYFYVSILFM